MSLTLIFFRYDIANYVDQCYGLENVLAHIAPNATALCWHRCVVWLLNSQTPATLFAGRRWVVIQWKHF